MYGGQRSETEKPMQFISSCQRFGTNTAYRKPSIKRQPCLNSFALKYFGFPQRLLLLLQDRRSPDLPALEELQVLAALNTPQVSIQPSRTREG